jgi:hypothetical protein
MDPDAICGADDKLLEDLGLCAKGDICALRSYCQGWHSSSTPSGSFTQTLGLKAVDKNESES